MGVHALRGRGSQNGWVAWICSGDKGYMIHVQWFAERKIHVPLNSVTLASSSYPVFPFLPERGPWLEFRNFNINIRVIPIEFQSSIAPTKSGVCAGRLQSLQTIVYSGNQLTKCSLVIGQWKDLIIVIEASLTSRLPACKLAHSHGAFKSIM